jgi:adenylylsulfate reductase subunit B
MGAVLDEDKCLRCGRCGEICPGGLISAREGSLPAIPEPGLCWDCAACLKECPAQALCLSLHPLLGGRGAVMTAARKGRSIVWSVTFPDGSVKTIESDSRRRED